MLIVAVVEFSPFDGLIVGQWIERNWEWEHDQLIDVWFKI